MMINRQHKDRLFSFLFGREENKPWTLALYNAINGSHYTKPEDMEIITIEKDFVRVRMLNINYGKNITIMQSCPPLAEYAWLIEEIRKNKKKGMSIEAAVNQAVREMPAEYAIKEFLMGHRAEGAQCPVDIGFARTGMEWRK